MRLLVRQAHNLYKELLAKRLVYQLYIHDITYENLVLIFFSHCHQLRTLALFHELPILSGESISTFPACPLYASGCATKCATGRAAGRAAAGGACIPPQGA